MEFRCTVNSVCQLSEFMLYVCTARGTLSAVVFALALDMYTQRGKGEAV